MTIGKMPYPRALFEAAKAINSTLVANEVLRSLVENAARAVEAKGCSIMLLSPDGKQLLHTTAYGLSDWYVRKGPIRPDVSIAEAMEGKVVVVTDVAKDPRIQYREQAVREGIASILSIPLVLRDEIIGVMRVYAATRREYSPEEIDFLQTIANLGATALENARHHEALEHSLEETKNDLLEWSATWSLQQAEKRPAVAFAHPSEEEFARILDFYRVRWQYEPRSFPLQWEGERVTEMFTPDFYLPDLDLYIELTTMKQSLVTEKNRKLRRTRELYPEVNVRLLYRRDYHRMLAKYGYGPLEDDVGSIGQVLFSAVEIEQRVTELGQEISRDYAGRRPLLVGVLRGMVCFMADLMRHISLPVEVDFMAISSYEGDGVGAVRIVKDLNQSAAGRDLLMVEDIVDTGMTLNHILKHLRSHDPASLEVCTLLDKRVRRLVEVPLRYVGFEVPDEFLVGYGLDYREQYRNLPFIATLRPEISG